MSYVVTLPKDDEQAEEVIKRLLARGESVRSVHEVQWWFNHYYLHGARDFTGIDFQAGTLDVNYTGESDLLSFRYEDIVSKFQAQVGRLLQMDLNPQVRRRSIGLEDMRNATLAQIALGAAIPPSVVKQIHHAAIPPLLKYGCVGFAVWNHKDTAGIDLVMPWELVPIPPRPLEDSEVRGVARVRWVPVDWVKQLDYVKNKHIAWDSLETIMLPVGEIPSSKEGRFSTFGGSIEVDFQPRPRHQMGGGKTEQDKTQVPITKFAEIWIWSENLGVKEYIVMAGGRIVHRKNYEDSPRRVPRPLLLAVDIPVGGFFGRGFISVNIPMNTETEFSLGRLFQNIQDFDTYGILCTPTTLGIPTEAIRGQDGVRRLPFAPDYTVPELKPFNIEPANAGTLPAQALKIAIELSRQISNQPSELMGGQAPGRTDSKAGLGFLFEVSNIPLTSTALSLATALSGCYETILWLLPSIWDTEKAVEVAMLDDAMAGVQLNPSTGTVTLNTGLNVLPHPDTVDISVKSMYPRSKEQEKLELGNALTAGVIDLTEYRIEVRKRDLGLPVGNEAEWQNWRRAVMNNILVWNDGQSPGQVAVNDYDMHDIHIRVLQAFMARPEFYAASEEVRQKFTDLLLAHQSRMATFPEQLPYPEDAALQEQAPASAVGMGQGAI
jgi:hypothetical protein